MNRVFHTSRIFDAVLKAHRIFFAAAVGHTYAFGKEPFGV